MGYYTDFSLTFQGDENDIKNITSILLDEDYPENCPDNIEPISYSFHKSGDELKLGGVKWYEYKENMKSLSAAFPNVLFILNGWGEETGDIWRNFFKDGKVQVAKTQIVFDEFDPEELK